MDQDEMLDRLRELFSDNRRLQSGAALLDHWTAGMSPDRSEEFFRSGLYVRKDLPDHGYYVSSSTKKFFSLTLCCISQTMWYFSVPFKPYKVYRIIGSVSPLKLREFITLFMKQYSLAKQNSILAYRYKIDRTFFIDRSANAVMWDDGDTYALDENNRVVIKPKYDYFGSIRFSLKDDERVKLQFCGKRQTRKPTSLESCLFHQSKNTYIYKDDWENQVPFCRRVCEFELKFEEKDKISVCVITRNPNACWYYRNEDLFDTLSKQIVKTFSNLRERYCYNFI